MGKVKRTALDVRVKQVELKRGQFLGVALVDAYPIARLGYVHLLRCQPDLQLCGEAATASEALRVIRSAKPAILVVDPALPDMNGLQFIKMAKEEWPPLKVLVVSAQEESLHAELTLHAGADGYIRKTEPVEEILLAVRRVLDGQLYLQASLTERILRARVDRRQEKAASPVDRLSMRELEVLGLIGQWHRTREIAKTLHLSVKTVEYYRHNIKEKLRLRNATELTRFATQWTQQKSLSMPLESQPRAQGPEAPKPLLGASHAPAVTAA